MFARGAVSEKVKTWCYDEDAEDFTKGMLNTLLFILISTFECRNVFRCDCTGYLGSRSFESTVEECDDRSGFRFSTSFRAGDILPSLARTRHNGAFLQASLQGTVLIVFSFQTEMVIKCSSIIQEYMENIRVVDNIVREAEKLISEFYKDEDTSFVFTADHGMSTIGNHGDGRKFFRVVRP